MWGVSSHLDMVEKALHESLTPSEYSLHYLKPSSFGAFKTYDGIKVNGDRVLKEIFNEIETLKSDRNVTITKISVVGYSLGGLIARYCIGKLYEVEFFDTIEPVLFSTFATPHLGIRFFKTSRFLDRLMNFLGSRLVGQSGRDLFIHNSDLLPEMTSKSSTYYKGLKLFKFRILLANVRNDRLVSFSTSYISNYNAFENWENLDISFISGLPPAKLLGKEQVARVVDLKNTVYNPDVLQSPIPDSFHRTRQIAIVVVILILPIVFPVIFVASVFGTIKSAIRKSFISDFNVGEAWKSVLSRLSSNKPQHHDSVHEHRDVIAGATQNLVENTLQTLESESPPDVESPPASRQAPEQEKPKDPKDVAVDYDFDKAVEIIPSLEQRLNVSSISSLEVAKHLDALPYDEIKATMCSNLNELDWIKLPVYVRSLNAHEGIVARRGFKRVTAGAPLLYLWVLELHVVGREQSSLTVDGSQPPVVINLFNVGDQVLFAESDLIVFGSFVVVLSNGSETWSSFWFWFWIWFGSRFWSRLLFRVLVQGDVRRREQTRLASRVGSEPPILVHELDLNNGLTFSEADLVVLRCLVVVFSHSHGSGSCSSSSSSSSSSSGSSCLGTLLTGGGGKDDLTGGGGKEVDFGSAFGSSATFKASNLDLTSPTSTSDSSGVSALTGLESCPRSLYWPFFSAQIWAGVFPLVEPKFLLSPPEGCSSLGGAPKAGLEPNDG
ncbi:hypothetical protein OGAPHI_006052 [Ogataea philodendri]|uniref:DUF676 domain-containing protein n=1 Tax=Ogataea philodendri TaxID=1378263 RepID=A0A9P8NXT0_9ASCO|nr:uncharacterized protein OGAPHI_006052 [Ogataea philodendri]KAH3661873.1 hypothetical protein OGAPHI_006052 [Ogataea philodendri]